MFHRPLWTLLDIARPAFTGLLEFPTGFSVVLTVMPQLGIGLLNRPGTVQF
jgi:hypothetical protein